MAPTERAFYDFCLAQARLRDRLYFCSDETAAQALGVSRRTIQRCKRSLERSGAIKRCGEHRWGPRKVTIVYSLHVTQRSSCQKPPTAAGFRIKRYSGCSRRRASASDYGRRRRIMEQGQKLVVRKSGEETAFNAGDAIAATSDLFRMQGVPLAPQIRARLGKGAKALLEAEFSPEIVVTACVVAVRTGWFGSVQSIAQELSIAQNGKRTTRSEYQVALAEVSEGIKQNESRVWQLMRAELKRKQHALERGLSQ